MKDILDVEIEPISMPRRPRIFSAFLEDGKEKPEDTIQHLGK